MGDLDALQKVDVSHGLHGVQLGEHLARVGGEGDEDVELGERHQPDVGLRVGPELGLRHQVDGVLLGLQPRRKEVAVTHVLRVVHAESQVEVFKWMTF